jgi:UDPglucose 6-dehydrogenase
MRIAMVGTGYVGLVTGTCFADSGNDVICVDIDEDKIRRLKLGEIPIYEPGLSDLVKQSVAAGRLDFTTDLAAAVGTAELVYLAVGTPQDEDGSADVAALMGVAEAMAPHLGDDAIVVIKSTVPVGTNARVTARLKELTGRDCPVANNPEFLKEGAAVEDFLKPDRIVVGVRDQRAAEVLRELYAPFLRTEKPFLAMSPESAELTKYVANALLATKISFINSMANLCERIGGDINDVRRGIGHDSRIGFQFLFPGVGYGGSCFPKDVRALVSSCREVGVDPQLLLAIDKVNEAQKRVLLEKVEKHFGGNIENRRIAVWGLAFKPRTDDVREAPSLVLLQSLVKHGAKLQVHDPAAMENTRRVFGNALTYFDRPMNALHGAEALAVNTEWSEFRHPDFVEMRRRMAAPVIFDGRNLFNPDRMRKLGFTYHSIGRRSVEPG